MSKIKSVVCRTVSVPLEKPTAFARRLVYARDYTLVRIETEDGTMGVGFCYGGNLAGGLVRMAVRELFAPMLVGEDSHRTEGLWHEMYQLALLHGRAGSVMRAISIIDNALWDRNARAAGLPLYKYLGSAADTRVPAYASGGYYLDGKTPDMLGQELADYVGQGFRAVKMKVGRGGLAFEEARIKAAREAIGPDVLLMLDANNAWTDIVTARRYTAVYEPYNPFWIEEPFNPDDIQNHARLSQLTSIPVATGEIEAGRWRFKELLDQKAASILQADAAVCGGITEWRRIAATAASYGIDMWPHWFHDLHVHLVASTPNSGMVEYFAGDKVLNFRKLLNHQLEFEDGDLILPSRAGLGFDFDAEAVDRFATDSWA